MNNDHTGKPRTDPFAHLRAPPSPLENRPTPRNASLRTLLGHSSTPTTSIPPTASLSTSKGESNRLADALDDTTSHPWQTSKVTTLKHCYAALGLEVVTGKEITMDVCTHTFKANGRSKTSFSNGWRVDPSIPIIKRLLRDVCLRIWELGRLWPTTGRWYRRGIPQVATRVTKLGHTRCGGFG
jgi:hypothetical protein